MSLVNGGLDEIPWGAPVASKHAGTQVVLAEAADNLFPTFGLATADTAPGFAVEIQTTGTLYCSDWTRIVGSVSLSPGETYFLGTTPGTLTTTPPAAVGEVVQFVGVASDTHNLVIDIAPPILL